MHWFVTEHLSKSPKDWLPPPRPADNAPAYIEVSYMLMLALHGSQNTVYYIRLFNQQTDAVVNKGA